MNGMLRLWEKWLTSTEEGELIRQTVPPIQLGVIACILELERQVQIYEEFGGTLVTESFKSQVSIALRDSQRSLIGMLDQPIDVSTFYRMVDGVRQGPRRVIVSDDGTESELWPAPSSPPASPEDTSLPKPWLDEIDRARRNRPELRSSEALSQANELGEQALTEEYRRRRRKDDVPESGSEDEGIGDGDES